MARGLAELDPTPRIRPFRSRGKPAPDADALLDHMAEKAEQFDAGKVNESQVSKAAGGGDD
jgi:hypothetical protein